MKRTLLISGLFFVLSVQAVMEKQNIFWQIVSKRNIHMVQTLTKETIEQSTKPLIIKAFATWCPHCTAMEPIFKQSEKDLGQKYTFVELDIDKSPGLATQFNIKSLPTFVFIKNKREVGREIGSMTKENFNKLIAKYLD